ncbi:MAG: YggS family pyridoxal phosphate-dependent enzyme [Sutterellaceae bacterium]|nr:YggS family pyridoxal phosphate-dependent enzyme [Burkholderiaceae bacterium]MCX7901563.1 YggS family pyridoxal phosphate-dependent enzyme [Burkholderiaceae bacterium]MDW8429458.1 YggS family pyridoxal phosphate-dependent enzyme [Sutterellaceae bacterium]
MSTLIAALQANLTRVRERIAAAARAGGRDPSAIALVAVSKTFGAAHVLAAAKLGVRAFGENYVQEALLKIAQMRQAAPELSCQWHLIGPLQSNKTRAAAQTFDWVQTVDRLKIAERLSAQRPPHLPPLNVLIQVNISGEASKSGVTPAEVASLAHAVAALPRLQLRGLMAIPAPAAEAGARRAPFARLRALFEDLRAQGLPLDTLSMGMSEDLEEAIAEGATMVRVGTAIFGARAADTSPPLAADR